VITGNRLPGKAIFDVSSVIFHTEQVSVALAFQHSRHAKRLHSHIRTNTLQARAKAQEKKRPANQPAQWNEE